MLEGFFWISLLLFLHPYTTYPLSLVGLRLLGFPRSRQQSSATGEFPPGELPQVCVLVVAYNEQGEIGARIENLLEHDYPAERMDVCVVSDGSSDRTDEIVLSYGDRVRLVRSPQRVGKALCLNLGLKETASGVVVFTDANTEFAKDAVMRLVAPLADPSVGFVVGTQGYRTLRNAPAEKSESSYGTYETWLKQLENCVGSVVGGDGAIMAVRRELIRSLRPDDVSDLRIPLECVANGFRGYFQPAAKGWEGAPHVFRKQFYRKTRIIQRSILTMVRVRQVLNPFRTGMFAYLAVSHKVLRWFGPVLLLIATASSSLLVWNGESQYGWFLASVIALMGVAAGYSFPSLRRSRLVYLSFYFWLIQFAALVAITRLHRRDYYTLWEPARE
jgi:cellulose synthase/poly-beta-1,6-N-acetylglucosamine synthase-like glycosyltransferase